MAPAPYIIKRLEKEDRSNFSCGETALDTYFATRVSQDVRKRVANCFIAFDEENKKIAGFYTLSACHTDLKQLDEAARKKLPLYPEVPSVRLGRLAVDENYKGMKLGSALLAEAVDMSMNAPMGIHMMIVDAKDEKAATFYQHHGFRPDPDNPYILFAPLTILAKAIGISQ